MIDSEFFALLKTLHCIPIHENDANEFREFMKWANSSFVETTGPCRRLVQFLYERYYPLKRRHEQIAEPAVSDQSQYALSLERVLKKELVWEFIYPEKKFKDSQLTLVLSKTKSLLDDFISYSATLRGLRSHRQLIKEKSINLSRADKKRLEIDFNLMAYHLNRGEAKHFERIKVRVHRFMDAKEKDANWYEMAFNMDGILNDRSNRTPDTPDHYSEMSSHFDAYFILRKMEMYCAMLNRSYIFETTYQYPMMDILMEFNPIGEVGESILINQYRKVLAMLLKLPLPSDFASFWDEMLLQAYSISDMQLKQLCMYARNILQFSKIDGQEDIHFLNNYAFQVTEFMDRKGILGVEGSISDAQFIAVVKSALADQQLDWCQEFIANNAERLVGKYKEASLVYAEAYLSYCYGNPLASWKALKGIDHFNRKFRHLFFQIQVLEIKVLFSLLDQDDPEYADTHLILKRCQSTARNISNDGTLRDTRKVRLANFVTYVKKLVRLKFAEGTKGDYLHDLKKEVLQEPVEDKEWILSLLS